LLIFGGCGKSEKLSSADANRAANSVDLIQAAIDAGECQAASARTADFVAQAQRTSGPADLRRSLERSAEHLQDLIRSECSGQPAATAKPKKQKTPTDETGPTGLEQPTDGGSTAGGAEPTGPAGPGEPTAPMGDGGDDSGGVRPE
jgi:hypothetical protein